MRHVYRWIVIRQRFLSAVIFTFLACLTLSGPAMAMYNLAMFWRGTVAAVAPTMSQRMTSSGSSHSCAILSDSTVKCWGNGATGNLGNGLLSSSSTPVQVTGLSGVRSLSVTHGSACALLSDGTVKCWGEGTNGELGDGLSTTTPVPVIVSGLTKVVALSSSWRSHSQ